MSAATSAFQPMAAGKQASHRKRGRHHGNDDDDGVARSPPILTSETAFHTEPVGKKKKSSQSNDTAPVLMKTEHIDSDEASVGNGELSRVQKDEWKQSEIVTLLDQIQAVMLNDDNVKYSTMADKLEWDKVVVGQHTPAECKDQWICITTKLRRFRTMSELLLDAKQWAKHPWNAFGKKVIKHPELPKKPLTPYFRFFMRKRLSYSKKHPNMSVTELTKELSKKYGALSEHKKQKYIDAYNKDMEEWKQAMLKFRQAHPEALEDIGGSSSGTYMSKQFGVAVPPKTITTMQIYINEKCEEEQRKGSKVTRKELYERYKNVFQTLSDNKKLKYIKFAIEAKKKYDADMEKYCTEHPEYQPRVVKTFLSKAEQRIKDKVDGKPEKPPSNGYSLFTIETLPTITHLPNNERLGEVSRRWKKLSEDKKEAYNLKAEERNQEYKRAYSKYLLSLPDDVRRRLEKEDVDKQMTKKKTPALPTLPSSSQVSTPTIDRPLKPVADVFMFIEDKKGDYKKKYPTMDDNELRRFMVKEFNCISERDKAKYKKMAEQERERLARESAQSINNSLKKTKRVPLPGEPLKPSHSGYQLFSKEMLVQLRDVKANERLQEIGRRWVALSDEQKRHWNKRKDAMWVQYRKDLAKFKKGLSPKELKSYEEMNCSGRSKKKKKKSKHVEPEQSTSESSDADDNVEVAAVNGSDSDSDGVDDDDNNAAAAVAVDSASQSDSSSSDDELDVTGAVDVVTESDDDEAAELLEKKLLEDTASGPVQGKSTRLDANQVYNDDSTDSSSDSSSSDSTN